MLFSEPSLSRQHVITSQLIQKQEMPNGIVVKKKSTIFLETGKIQSQKNKLETQPLALDKLLVFSERSRSRKHEFRCQLVRKQEL